MAEYRVITADLARDRAVILDIWRRNLSSADKLEEKYEWHFLNNPGGEGVCCILLADGAPIGTACAGIRSLWSGSAVERIGVACDFAVDHRHRTLGPASMLQKAIVSCARGRERLRLLYGAPNHSGSAAIRRIGYRDAGEVHRYARIIRLSHYAESRLRLGRMGRIAAKVIDAPRLMVAGLRERLSDAYVVESISRFDGRFDDLWLRFRATVPVAIVRDSRYLEWRYGMCPLNRYTTVALSPRDRSRLEGYLIYYKHGPHMMVTDFLSAEQHANELLSAAVIEARKCGAASISWHCSLPPRILAMMRQRGFRRRTKSASETSTDTRKAMPGIERARSLLIWSDFPDDPALRNQWYFTAGDEPYNNQE